MRSTSRRRRKVFTVEEANRCLPLVRSIVRDWVMLSTQVAEGRERIAFLLAGRDPQIGDVYSDELTEVQATLDTTAKRLDRYIGELSQLGVIPHDANSGAVDFPAEIEGKEVFLCWEIDDPEVAHWRPVGNDRRRPLAPEISNAVGGEGPIE